jgi:lipid-A-disaccharide synthase
MKYYIIAGEPSGDLHASNLMRELHLRDKEAQIRFWGGDLMLAQGGEMVRHYKDTAVMGVFDVVMNLGKIQRNFKLCKRDIVEHRPDVLILVDYPGFNLPMAEYAHKRGIKVFYYISPKVWASKEYRVKKMRKYIDALFTILPFETEYFKKHNIDVHYCGNPIMDAIENRAHKGEIFEDFCKRNDLDSRPKIALLAGSRKGELKYCLPEMLKAVDKFPQYQFVVAGAPSFSHADYEEYVRGYDVKVIFGETYQLVSQSRAALVTSGTATLETAILNCPEVLIYLMWGGGFSDWVARKVIKVPYIGLVNLILGRDAVHELFQKKYSYERMLRELEQLVGETPERQRILQDYVELREVVGGPGCSGRAAQMMLDVLSKT